MAEELHDEVCAMCGGDATTGHDFVPCEEARTLRSQLAEARETNVRLNRRCQAYEAEKETIERLTRERDGWKNMAESLNRGELHAFLDEVKPVLLWVCKTPGFGKWEDLARTLIGKWPK